MAPSTMGSMRKALHQFAAAALIALAAPITGAHAQNPSLLDPPPEAPGESIDLDQFKQSMRHIMNNVVQVPGTNLVAADVNGALIIILPNKRFAVVGKVFDIFEGREMKTLDDIKEARRVDFVEMGMDFTELSTFTVGSGPREVVIFTDPLCPQCGEIAREAMKLTSRYTVHFVLFPITAEGSKPAAERILCGDDADGAVRALTTSNVSHLPEQEPGCADARFTKTAMLAMMLSVRVVPYVFAPNGLAHIGRPESLRSFLTDNH